MPKEAIAVMGSAFEPVDGVLSDTASPSHWILPEDFSSGCMAPFF